MGRALTPAMIMVERKPELTEMIAVRLTPDDRQRLETLKDRLHAIPRLALARAALRIGMSALEEDPSQLFARPASKDPRAA